MLPKLIGNFLMERMSCLKFYPLLGVGLISNILLSEREIILIPISEAVFKLKYADGKKVRFSEGKGEGGAEY